MPMVAGGFAAPAGPGWYTPLLLVGMQAPPKTPGLRIWRGSFSKEMGYIYQKKGGLNDGQAKNSNCLLH